MIWPSRTSINEERDMWGFLKKLKGRKLESSLAKADRPAGAQPGVRRLWHGIDKYAWELKMNKRQMYAKGLGCEWLVANAQMSEELVVSAYTQCNTLTYTCSSMLAHACLDTM